MNIQSASSTYASGQAQRLLQALLHQKAQTAGQTVPGGQDDDTNGAESLAPPTPTGGPNAAQMASKTLASLLSTQEQPPSAEDIAGKILSKVDTNGDGKLSLDEIKAALGGDSTSSTASNDAFAKVDTNGDGAISADELTAAIKSRHGHHGHAAQADGPSSTDVAKSLVSSADTDGDGVLSADEIAAASGSDSSSTDLKTQISKLDTNGDGKLSPAEVASAIDAFKAANKATSTTASATTASATATV